MRPTRKTLVFVATQNDASHVADRCREVLAVRPGCDLLVVDEGSTDTTVAVVTELARSTDRLRVVPRPRPLGRGSAHLLAVLHAVQQGYEALVTIGHDHESVSAIPSLVAGLETSQCCQAHADGGARGSGITALIAGPLAGLPVGQTVHGVRSYRVELLAGMDLSELPEEELPFLVEFTQRLRARGARIRTLSVTNTTATPEGVTTGLRAAWRAITGALTGRARKRPDPEAVDTRCYACNSRFLVERFRRSGDVSTDVRAYQCTSMDHRSKPQVLGCLQCGLQYVQESEMPTGLESMYADVVDQGYLDNIAARRKTFEEVYARIEPLLPHGEQQRAPRMLELGCYCGAFMEVARERGWDVQGIEPSRWASSYAREQGLEVHCGTLDDFPSDGTRYDAIVMWDVLEHVKDPIGLLEQASQLLEDDGVIFLSTLDVDNWFPRLLGKAWPWLMSMHIFYYSADGLADLYRRAGLRMDDVQSYCHYISVRYFVEKLRTLAPPALRPLLSWMIPLTPRSLFIPFHFGDIKLYTGSKQPTAVPVTTAETSATVAVPELTP